MTAVISIFDFMNFTSFIINFKELGLHNYGLIYQLKLIEPEWA